MKTIVRVSKKAHPFVQIDRRVFEDTRMSWKAKGLLGYLLSRPDDWCINMVDLTRRSTDGRDSVYAAMNELSEFGYATHERVRDENGRMTGGRWTVHEEPTLTTSGFSVSGETVSGKTVSGKSDTTNKNRQTDKKEQTKREEGAEVPYLMELMTVADALGNDFTTERWKIRDAYKCDGKVYLGDGTFWEHAPIELHNYAHTRSDPTPAYRKS